MRIALISIISSHLNHNYLEDNEAKSSLLGKQRRLTSGKKNATGQRIPNLKQKPSRSKLRDFKINCRLVLENNVRLQT